MLKSRFIPYGVLVGVLVLGAETASAQAYPTKTIRLVTTGVGGGGDFMSRVIAEGLSASLGQPVVVDNRPPGVPSAILVAKAPPDGYTLFLHGSGLWIGPLLQKAPYDPVADFAPISMPNRQPNVLVVNPTLPVSSAKELIALAKARPGELNYSSGTSGSGSHLAAELFKSMAGVDIVRIPYKSVSLRTTALLSNEVQLEFATPSGVIPHINSGKLRALGVTGLQPSPLFPGLPTVAATGLPGYEADTAYGLFAPAKTPSAIINRLSEEVAQYLRREDVRDRFVRAGIETVGSSPQELAMAIKREMARLGQVIRDANIREE